MRLSVPMLAVSLVLAVQPAQAGDSLRFLAETVCTTTGGALAYSALEGTCDRRRPRALGDRLSAERHDWPGVRDNRKSGYQRSTSYVAADGAIVQTFDFGDGARRFGRFDSGDGDGGQVVRVNEGFAVITLTEDGGGGLQYFAGSRCAGERDPSRSGWVLFGPTVPDSWTETVARLRIVRSAGACPDRFDQSYTRWRASIVDWPFLTDGRREPASRPLRTIVSEHYGGPDIARSHHLERFFLVEDLGMARWERWESDRSERSMDRARRLSASGRCPIVNGSEAPATGWEMVDCRTWTNLVTSEAPAATFEWPTGIQQ